MGEGFETGWSLKTLPLLLVIGENTHKIGEENWKESDFPSLCQCFSYFLDFGFFPSLIFQRVSNAALANAALVF